VGGVGDGWVARGKFSLVDEVIWGFAGIQSQLQCKFRFVELKREFLSSFLFFSMFFFRLCVKRTFQWGVACSSIYLIEFDFWFWGALALRLQRLFLLEYERASKARRSSCYLYN